MTDTDHDQLRSVVEYHLALARDIAAVLNPLYLGELACPGADALAVRLRPQVRTEPDAISRGAAAVHEVARLIRLCLLAGLNAYAVELAYLTHRWFDHFGVPSREPLTFACMAADNLGDEYVRAVSYTVCSDMLRADGWFNKALAASRASDWIFQSRDDAPHLRGRGRARVSIGRTLLAQGELEQGQEMLETAMALHAKADDLHGQALCELHLAQAGYKRGDYPRALQGAERAGRVLLRELERPDRFAGACAGVVAARALGASGRLDEGLARLAPAEQDMRDLRHIRGQGLAAEAAGYLYAVEGEYETAIDRYRQARTHFEGIDLLGSARIAEALTDLEALAGHRPDRRLDHQAD